MQELKQEVTLHLGLGSREGDANRCLASFLLHIPFGTPAHETVLPTVRLDLLPQFSLSGAVLIDEARRVFSW